MGGVGAMDCGAAPGKKVRAKISAQNKRWHGMRKRIAQPMWARSVMVGLPDEAFQVLTSGEIPGRLLLVRRSLVQNPPTRQGLTIYFGMLLVMEDVEEKPENGCAGQSSQHQYA
jgi:hypothetical protein